MALRSARVRLKTARNLQRKKVMLILTELNGERRLTVLRTDWRGVRWERRFKVIAETDSSWEEIPWNPSPTVKPGTNMSGRSADTPEEPDAPQR